MGKQYYRLEVIVCPSKFTAIINTVWADNFDLKGWLSSFCPQLVVP